MKNTGADIISQTVGTTTSFLGYDGHGSTRTSTDALGAVTDTVHFDGYGMDLGWDRDTDVEYNQVNQPATDMLYSGEQYDTPLQMQYLRARYYDQNVGGFNRLDDYAGNMNDPQSLHKYAYCHQEPVNHIDPSGKWTLTENLFTIAMITALIPILTAAVLPKREQARLGKFWNQHMFGWAGPDAIVLGGMADGAAIIPLVLSLLGMVNMAVNSGNAIAAQLRNIPIIAGIVGAEIMINFVSGEIATFFYAGGGVLMGDNALISGTFYGGLVWSCKDAAAYTGPFFVGTKDFGSFAISEMIGYGTDSARGITFGVSSPGTGTGGFITNYKMLGPPMKMSGLTEAMLWSAAFGAATTATVPYFRNPMGIALGAGFYGWLPIMKYEGQY